MNAYEDRLVMVSRIEPNPLRDFDIYPIHMDRLEQLEESYRDGDFGTIIPVRPHPRKEGFYQQACGHHRLAAMKAEGKPLKILCRISDFDDDQMASIMVRENMNNYGNNPEAVADSVAAVSKVLIYWMFLSENYAHFSQICEKSSSLFVSGKEFDSAKGRLVSNNQIGEPLISDFFGKGAHASPLKLNDVRSGIAALNATGKMAEICKVQRAKADRVLAAKKREERERAEEAERKAEEARKAREAWLIAEEARKKRLAEEREAAKKLKDKAERVAEEARIAQAKADADKEQRRQKALEAERIRLVEEAKTAREKQAAAAEAQAKIQKAKANAEERGIAPWLHPAVFGMFENQGQFDAFRSTLNSENGRFKKLFPVDDQVNAVKAMLSQLNAQDNLTAKGIRGWIHEQDAKFHAELERKKADAEKARQDMIEANNRQAKADRIMDETAAALARMSRAYEALHKAHDDPQLWELIMMSPHATTVRSSLERQYGMLPELERFFDISARRFSTGKATREEKVING